MVESDQEDEEDPYSNIGLPPTTMAPTVPIVHQPLTVFNPLQRSSSVVIKILMKSKELINICNHLHYKFPHQ